ncbi:hypothetical protein ASPCADRAFT_209402, partial [Aspergillus carbonarius ITEM 5010]
ENRRIYYTTAYKLKYTPQITPQALPNTTRLSTGTTVYISIDTSGRYLSRAIMIGLKSTFTNSTTSETFTPLSKLINTTNNTIFITLPIL